MPPPSLTQRAHAVVLEVLRPGDWAIDATAGNGNDTLLLANAVGPTGRVLAYDTQEAAIERTRERLASTGVGHVELRRECHSELAQLNTAEIGTVRAVMFNLGYLPGGNHQVVTRPETTRTALEAATRLIAPGGRITVLVYRGHTGGAEESDEVRRCLEKLPSVLFSVRCEGGAIPAGGAVESTPWLAIVERVVVN